ncbi:type II secretion system protein E [Sphingomonas astaxanthinifaciens DSM 22298]|uniref:Type II secretion system protein E n=2 Tax=Sphingomonas TaxID=13687 RepID=A0ABQ5Z8C3_9SPHN|nr:CpaF family protein [Sphingomonas astaxanthinifaciens]GLR47103.1 type II secretion system protein E [Sphingomonas astaxanthinifaciens DSM 22298]
MWQIRKPNSSAAPAEERVEPTLAERQLMSVGDAGAFAKRDVHTDLKVELHQRLIDCINLSALDGMSREQIAEEVGEIVEEELAKQNHALNLVERRRLIDDVLDELLGLGPLEPLLKDTTITDILVNGPDRVFVERYGQLEPSPVRFKDDKHLLRIIQKIVSAVGRRVDESSPLVDARLMDGSRVNAVVPPLALDGSLLSIRKFAKVPISMSRLVEIGSIPAQVAEVLKAIVASRRNVLISGGTGSGKTTLLNAMSAFIDNRERIVTIEDSAELQLQQSHVARLETRPANIEGKGEIGQRDLVKNALRMRPDRIIVGEVRAGEAFDMLQAMNTGHDGSMTTVHANTPRDALSRLEQMIGMSGIDIPARSARAQIASAINVVVQIARLSDGRRRLMSLSEITGMEGDVVTMQEIFRFRQTGISADGGVIGKFEATGLRPRFLDHAITHGQVLSPDLFRPDARFE